jgi:hypothetical protein
MAISDLTDNMNTIKDNGKADLKLSEATRDKYLKIIDDHRADMDVAVRQIRQTLESFGNVGSFQSAHQVKDNLLLDVKGPLGVEATIDNYNNYLDTLAETVKKAANRLINSG